ncbi:MAG: antitoxin [Nanoarchaeota archaeon]
MAQQMISARVNINDYANRVLGIVKLKYGLKDKSEALNKFIELYGNEIIEKQASDNYIKKISGIAERHFKKYGKRKMSIEELDKLCEEK